MQDALPQVRHTTAEAGDQLREWIRTQYEEYGPGLRRYLVRLTGDAAEAEDISQDVFLRLYEQVGCSRPVQNLRPWLFQTGHNLAVDLLRRKGREHWVGDQTAEGVERQDSAPNAESVLLTAERDERVRRGLSFLTAQERQVLELRAEGLRYREIAELMGLQIPTVATFASRGIRKIARQLHG